MAKQRKHLVRVTQARKWRAGQRERAPGHDIDFIDFDRAPANDNGLTGWAVRAALLAIGAAAVFFVGVAVLAF